MLLSLGLYWITIGKVLPHVVSLHADYWDSDTTQSLEIEFYHWQPDLENLQIGSKELDPVEITTCLYEENISML